MSPLPNFATWGRPLAASVRMLAFLGALLHAAAAANGQELSTFPETPRPIRRLDHATPVALSDPLVAESAVEAGKTPIRRVSDVSATASPASRSPATVWLVLIGIVAVASLVSYWSRRSGAGGHWKIPATVLQVLGRTQVSPNQSVTLLRLGERVLLVSSSGATLQTLAVITDPAEVAAMTAECLSQRSSHLAAAMNGPSRRGPQPPPREPSDSTEREPGPVAGSIGHERASRRRAGEREHA